ncbi:hypothetical protein JNUCC32_30035 [Paenibacillus sp. JNUCC32]|uniref:hypothetical protein n=1 Tax=Paenibacillus sp. JNUCC32 TaxID=2777984 RepID=UPI0017882B00|nr:hypothetical protein [Paenibacillus sp. JNUCC-32]QOT10273.1 hypothetical protein JNUCC32_30035 [Paenibacillus sp. JNUCC-32]
MAEAMNYRMNLVIDPKNVIKANRELRAMERYFERIQGRVMRIGRTRMAPEIVLKDSASKGLDNLLAKMQRVKSQVIQASANVKLNVQKQIDTNLNLSVQKQIEASVQVDLRAAGLDFSPMIAALNANTTAVDKLTDALGSLQLGGGGSGKKSGWDTALGILGGVITVGATVRSGTQMKGKYKDMKGAWGNKVPENKPAETKSIGNKPPEKKTAISYKDKKGGKNNVIPFPKKAAAPETKQVSKSSTMLGNARNKAEKIGDFVETVGTFGQGAVKGLKHVWDGAKNIFGGGGASGIVSGGAASAVKAGAGSDAVKQAADGSTGANAVKNAGKSGLGSGLMKGLGKRALGPLSFIADATAIATAKPGKERNQAIGSTVGGGIGSTIGGLVGSVIPVAGTMIGSTLGGTVGSFIGEKVGGAITGIGDKFNEGKETVSKWFSKTFSFGKKDKEAAQPKEPPSSAAALPAPIIPKPAPTDFSKPLLPNPTLSPTYGPYMPPTQSTLGPPVSAAQNQALAGKPTSPQSVQISPEQMSTISGLLMDFKTETTVNYNLPSGAVQVTVHEEHPIDVEGLILLIGQRLRAEFSKAAQNRKPTPMAY